MPLVLGFGYIFLDIESAYVGGVDGVAADDTDHVCLLGSISDRGGFG